MGWWRRWVVASILSMALAGSLKADLRFFWLDAPGGHSNPFDSKHPGYAISPQPSLSPSPSPASSPSQTLTPTPLLTETPTETPSELATGTFTPTESPILTLAPTETATPTPSPSPTAVVVTSSGFSFSPASLSIPSGAPVNFVLSGHTADIDDGSGTGSCSSVDLVNGGMHVFVGFSGEVFQVHCDYHSSCGAGNCAGCAGMVMTVTIQ